jgi:hypothetical protein
VEGSEKLYPAAKIVKSEERGPKAEEVRDEAWKTGVAGTRWEGVTELAFFRILYTIRGL